MANQSSPDNMQELETSAGQPEQAESSPGINEILWICLSKWHWFVVSMILCCGLGAFYILHKEPVYERSATLLIKNDSAGSGSADFGQAFSDMGFLTTNTEVCDELASITSPTVMIEVCRRLGLDVVYSAPGLFHRIPLYGNNLPVILSFPDLGEKGVGGLEVTLNADSTLTLADFIDKKRKRIAAQEVGGRWNRHDTIATPLGRVVVYPNPNYRLNPERPLEYPFEIKVWHSPLQAIARDYQKKLAAEIPEDYSSVISLSLNDVSTQRAEDILNAVINVYNENWISDKNRISVSTDGFLRDRLAMIEAELGDVDSDISTYKAEHLVPDLQQASALYFSQAAEANREADQLAQKLSMAEYLGRHLSDPARALEVLPASTSLENLNIENQITAYNTLLLERNNFANNSSDQNPLVIDKDRQLEGMRKSILQSIDNYKATLKGEISRAKGTRAEASSQLQANPTQARYLLSVERQQKVKESLYLYLLQRREENELSQAFTAYNTRIITPPMGDDSPIAPSRRNVMLIAIFLGLLIPSVTIYLSELLDTKIRGRKDIEHLSIPFAGEIPLGYRRRHGFARLRRPRDNERDQRVIVVKKSSGDSINEAFRVLRTNLELMTDVDAKGALSIMVTSANPGSGKTFITMNLAVVLAIKGKRVAVVDLDLRKASLSAYVGSPATGVSAYLSGRASIDEITNTDVNSISGLDLIPVGALPPNPAEILYSPRLGQLIDTLRSRYDYILLDCPPAEIVTDAKIINSHADMTLFIVRAGLFDRSMLPRVESFYATGRYRRMALILNGTENNSLGSLRSPYGYGYGYGYAYSSKSPLKR